jgi:PAS domain S-box-containing protein
MSPPSDHTFLAMNSFPTLGRISQTVAGILVIGLGVLSLTGWLCHTAGLLPGWLSPHHLIKIPTALLFVLCGAALLQLGTSRERIAAGCGTVTLGWALLVLLAYLTGWYSGVDQTSHRLASGEDTNPDRMSPLAAGGLILTGVSLLLAGWSRKERWRTVVTGILGCTVGAGGLVAFYGHVAGIEPAYGWGSHTRLPIPAALGFLFLGVGLVAWTRHNLSRHSVEFINWLPVAVALALTLMVSLVLTTCLVELKTASDARKQNHEALTQMRSLLGGLADMQRGMRVYLLTGQPEAWTTTVSGRMTARQALAHLASLLSDNPSQTALLASIQADFTRLEAYTEKLAAIQAETGSALPYILESENEGFALSNRLAADLKKLTQAENALLEEHTALAENRFQDTARLELIACVVTGLLIVLTVGVAQREIGRRRATEEDLRKVASLQKAILNSTEYAIVSTDTRGIITVFNSAAERMLGYKAEEVIGKLTPLAWHDEDEIAARAREISRDLNRSVAPDFEVLIVRPREGQTEEREWTIKRRDGSTFPGQVWVTPLETEPGEVSGFLGVLTDLTERRKTQSDLERSTRRLEAMLHTSIDGVIVFESVRNASGELIDLRYCLLNPAAESLMEHPASEVIGRSIREIPPMELTGDLFEKFVRIIEKDEPLDFEHKSHHGGRVRWYRIAGAKLGDGLLLSYAEITVRKEAEEKLRTLVTRLDLATQAMQAGVWDWNVCTDEIFWDGIARGIFGLDPQEPVTREKWLATLLEEDRDRTGAAVHGMVQTRQKIRTEYRIRRPDGTIRHIQMAAAPLLDDNGDVVRIIGVNLDVTERKEREEALRLSEQRFASAFEHATTGMALVAPDGRWLKVNDAVCSLLGYSAEELADRTFQDLTHPDDLKNDLENVARLLSGETEFYKIEKRYIHKMGHIVWAQLGVSLLRDEHGKPLYFISQIEDISEIKRALFQQEDLLQKAQAAERAKSEFLAMMSHEIRTPMNGVLGYAELLASTPMEKDQKECLDTIITCGEALLRIIDDILDFSRIESGRMSLYYAPFHVGELIRGVKAVLAPKARQKAVGIEVHIESPASQWFIGDAGRIRQVLINLVGNALKFTETGRVLISFRADAASETDPVQRLHFSVSDTGEGIPSEKLREIFRPFTQADSSIARRYGGTGLGLAISQRLVELMGGSLQVQSQTGQGSTFTFSIPLQLSPAPLVDDRERPGSLDASFASRYPLDILVADDDRVNLGLITAILKRLGYEPRTVNDGHGVLKAFAQSRPDCILLDMHMPEVDGCDAAARIRRIELSSGAPRPCYISALTANVLPTERMACLKAGMNDFLSKPFKLHQLAEVLKKAFAAKTAGSAQDLT